MLTQGAPPSAPPLPREVVDLDPLSLLLHASGPARIVSWALIVAAVVVWVVAVLALRRLGRLDRQERAFESDAAAARGAPFLTEIARRHRDAPARASCSMAEGGGDPDLVESHARRALVTEEQRAGSLLGVLSTVGSAGPFVGLFGTVWGILDAFLRIGREKSASLPVVAPAIGEALIATAVGLFAAIPAVVLFNVTSKRQDDLLAGVEAAAGAWIALFRRHAASRRSLAGARGSRPWASKEHSAMAAERRPAPASSTPKGLFRHQRHAARRRDAGAAHRVHGDGAAPHHGAPRGPAPAVAAGNTPVRDAKLVVTVTREGRILLGEDDITAKVEGVLATNRRVQKERRSTSARTRRRSTGSVARVVAAARAAGVDGLNLLVEPEP